MTVLVADDSASLRATTREILEAEGHRVLEAADGAVALQVMHSEDVDVLVLDLHMPGCDGFEVLNRLEDPHPLVVVFSGFEGESLADVEAEFGPRVFGYLCKPASPVALIEVVNAALEASQRTL